MTRYHYRISAQSEYSREGYANPDEAFAAWIEDHDPATGDKCQIAQSRSPQASTFTPGMVTALGEAASDEYSEQVDGWPDVTPEQESELQVEVDEVVDSWATKHNLQPTFYELEEVEIRTYIASVDGPTPLPASTTEEGNAYQRGKRETLNALRQRALLRIAAAEKALETDFQGDATDDAMATEYAHTTIATLKWALWWEEETAIPGGPDAQR